MTITFSIKIIMTVSIIFLPREIMWVVSTRVVDASALQAAPSVAKKEYLIFYFFPSYFFHAGSTGIKTGVMEDNFDFGQILHFGHYKKVSLG